MLNVQITPTSWDVQVEGQQVGGVYDQESLNGHSHHRFYAHHQGYGAEFPTLNAAVDALVAHTQVTA